MSIGQHSLQNLLPYDLYEPEAKVFINQKSLGWGLSLNPATGANEELVQILANLLTDVLPKNSNLQFLLYASPKIGDALDAVTQHCGNSELIKIQIEYLKTGAYKSLSKAEDFILRDFKLFIFFSVPKNHPDAKIYNLVQYRDDVISSLKSLNLNAEILEIKNFINLMADLLSPNQSVYPNNLTWNKFEPINQQITDTEQLLEIHPDNLTFKKSNETFKATCLSTRNFPERHTLWKMSDAIGQLFNSALQIPSPYLISLNIHLLDKDKIQNKVQTKILGKDKKARNSQILTWLPSIANEYQDWQLVRERLTQGDNLVHVFFSVVLFAKADELAKSQRKLLDLYQANGWKLRIEAYLQLPAFLASLPMLMSEGLYQDLKYFGRLKTITAFNSINIAPLIAEWRGYVNPLLVLAGRRGQIAWWDPFANDQGNYNTAIAASSGKGKSVFVQYYIASLLGRGDRCWVIDIGHSYEKTCKILNGEFIEFSVENPIRLNFFTNIKTLQDFKENLPMLVPLVATMARQKSSTTEEEDKYLEKAITDAWQRDKHLATITTIKNILENYQNPIAANLAHLLTTYARGGMYADFFEGESEINFNNPLIVLELLGLKNKKSLQQVVLLSLITQIHQAMYLSSRNTRKSCIIDEAWDLLGDGESNSAKFIETGYRTARRHNANFVSITQSINDYYKNATSLAAFMNADFTIVLGQKAQDIEQLQKNDRFPVDGFVKKLLKSLRMVDKEYSEMLIQSPHGMSVHRIILSPYLRILFSSKGEEFELVKQFQAQGLSLHDAVKMVVKLCA